jgi:hypothetical protein
MRKAGALLGKFFLVPKVKPSVFGNAAFRLVTAF